MSTTECDIPFSFFVDLVQTIAKIKPHRASEKQTKSTRYVDTPVYQTFTRWVKALRTRYTPLPLDTTAIIFRFLFPEEDVQRKYGLQETRLAQHLVKILGVSTEPNGRGERLKAWKEGDAVGCLGAEIEAVMSAAVNSQASTNTVAIGHVDALLTELAANCAFSASTARGTAPRRTREAILTSLYTSLTPAECAVVTQIILKDLRPLLYPIPRSATHYTAALLQYKSNAVAMLTKEGAMHAWDPSGRMKVIYGSRACLEDAARSYDQLLRGDGLPQPEFGKRIQIPKCAKGQGPAQALRTLRGADKVWVETKYDGERAQIHVQLDDGSVPPVKIQIFSKSGRDSTWDRAGVHGVIHEALGLLSGENEILQKKPAFSRNIIVEAEMVAFSDDLGRIDEFWRIRSLIASTAIGIRHKSKSLRPVIEEETQISLISNASDGGTRHLALVFFDILLLDDVSLLYTPYGERRSMLEQVIQVVPGRAMLAERTCIDMRKPDAEQCMRAAFAKLIADREEGAVLKADGARYAEWRWPWVKLKRDYINGYGDMVDLVLLGASWDRDRGRELRVPHTVYTTFYFGALANGDALAAKSSCRPHFDAIFTSSYGLSREHLEELNFMIKNSDPVPNNDDTMNKLFYTYAISSSSVIAQPTIFLSQPLLAELVGAGFTKAPGNRFYELRFPRICKIFRPSDRPWTDGVSLTEFQQIARTAVGHDRSGKTEDDWARGLFRPVEPASPGVRCPKKRKQIEYLWIDKLEAVDGNTSGKAKLSKRARTQNENVESRRTTTDVLGAENAASATVIPPQAGSDELLGKVGLSRLSSVTNLAATSSSAVRHFSGTMIVSSPPSSPQILATHVVENSPTPVTRTARALANSSIAPLNLRDPESKPLVQSVQASRPSLQPASDKNAPPSPSLVNQKAETRHERRPTTPSATPLHTLHQFLQGSIVWLAQPAGSPRPSWRAPSQAVIPTGNQVHTLDAVLLACGWKSGLGSSCGWSSRGVIFVDDSEDGQAYMIRTLSELAARRRELLAKEKTEGCKPVLVFSMKMLAYDALGVNVTGEELEGRAICRFG